ncbi:MAG TPA: ABC transporter permease [Candidatus Polarisedimenticolaceae bacterium]|nr:ABC transporter permease [Candidatus Polarisedimenticolaceae bacterium]
MKRLGTGWLENARFALGAMRDHKLRSFLTLLGVSAGVATLIMMVSFVVGFERQVTAAFTAFGTQLVQFQKFEPRFHGPDRPEDERTRRDLTIEDAEALKRLSRLVKAVSQERYVFGGTIVRAGRNELNGTTILGTNPDYAEANVHFARDGRFIADADVRHAARVCVIGPDAADTLFPLQDAIGREVQIGGRGYEVIGVFEHKGTAFGGGVDGYVAIPISAFDDQFPQIKNGGGDTIHIATVPRRAEDYEALIEEETAILRARRGLRPGQPDDFAVFTSVGQLRQFRQVTSGVAAAMVVIAAIALLVGGVGVMNIMLVNVTQRTREIGIRKALGARRRDIAAQFLVEAVTVTGVGGAAGIAFGLGAAFLVRATLKFEAAAPPWAVALGFAVSTAVGLIFGMWPALKAARQDPIEALRYE